MEDRIDLTSLRKFLVFQPMKKMITRLLVSVSIFSLVFSYSFSYYQNLNYFCSNSFYHILGRAMNKNFIFFIFNGLLVFLAKTSGFVLSSPSSDFDPSEMLQKRIEDSLEIAIHETQPEFLLEKDHVTVMEESREISKDQEQDREEEVEEKEEECLNQRAEDEVSIFIPESDDEESGAENDEYDSKNFWLFHDEEHLCGQEQVHGQEQVYGQEEEQQVYGQEEEQQQQEVYGQEEEEEEQQQQEVYGQEEEEEEEEQQQQVSGQEEEERVYEQEKQRLEMMSTEELNKKFEDFIRKMKEEIRIDEVRYQLLMVN